MWELICPESAIPLMNENIRLNLGAAPSTFISVTAAVLDWDEPLPSWVSVREGSAVWPDLIMYVLFCHQGPL